MYQSNKIGTGFVINMTSSAVRINKEVTRYKYTSFNVWLFFQSVLTGRNSRDPIFTTALSSSFPKNTIWNCLRPFWKSIFHCHSPKGNKFFTQLCLGISHVRQLKFKHILENSLNPFCHSGHDAKWNSPFLSFTVTRWQMKGKHFWAL